MAAIQKEPSRGTLFSGTRNPIRSGSTIVKIDGKQETLAAIIRKIQFSQEIAHQLALQTGMRKMAWEIDGKRYELTVGSAEPETEATEV